jgi:hypothetical protein
MDRISRRKVVQGASAAAVATTLGAPSVHAQKGRQTLRFVAEADLKILDPVSSDICTSCQTTVAQRLTSAAYGRGQTMEQWGP